MVKWSRVRPSTWSLLPTVVVLVMLALLLGGSSWIGISYLLTGDTPFTQKTSVKPLDALKIALSIIAGIGGVVALTVAYRRQREIESTRFGNQLATSAAQLERVS